MKGFASVDPAHIDDNFIRMIGTDWMLITAGTAERYNTMTASWGGVGQLWGQPMALVVIRPQRYTFGLVEEENRLTLSFPDERYRQAMAWCGSHSGREGDKFAAAGLSMLLTDAGVPAVAESRIILEGRKLYADFFRPENFLDRDLVDTWYPQRDFHKMYFLQITGAWVAEASPAR